MPTPSAIKLTNDTAMTTPGMDTQHIAVATYAIANVFFDGTENNYFNTNADPAVVQAHAKKAGDSSSSSYTNDLSNVARMWEAIRDTTDLNAVYIDGIGTARGKDDEKEGLALGKGDTGVRTRAEGAFKVLEDKFTENLGKKDLPPLLHINVYGFSRGAAAARYFVHLVKTQGRQRFKGKLKDVHIHVNFVGLFDTVSSVFVEVERNVKALHLNFDDDYAHKVFHIMAQDEYRANFAVTTIASAVKLGVGYEIAIPGAHSDVGGGYVDGATEKRLLDDWHSESFGDGQWRKLPGPSTRAFAYAQGWYTPGEPDQDSNTDRHSRKISNDYYKVALTLMVDMATKHGNIKFQRKFLEGATPKDADVLRILNALRPLVADEKPVEQRLEALVGADQAKAIRHKCMHMSLVDSDIAYGPRRNSQGEFKREVIQG